MSRREQYVGLTDEQVVQNRECFGANILTPPADESTWQKIKDCMHFWLLRLHLTIFILATLATTLLPLTGVYSHEGLWIAPALSFTLFFLTYMVAYLGGEWNEKKGKFRLDSLFTILLFALLLSGGIAFYNGIYGGVEGWEPYLELVGIAAAVLLATTVAHVLEKQNEKTFKSLNEVNDDTLVKVIRSGNVHQVKRREIVVGDIVILEAGEEIPADAELLESMNLMVDESSLTGEPTCAKTTDAEQFDKEATYPSNHIMKGCNILEGDCVAKVFAVGDSTACGKVFRAAQVSNDEATPLSEKLDELASLITKTSYAIAVLIVVGRLIRYALGMPSNNSTLLVTIMLMALGISTLIYFGLNKKRTEENAENIELWQLLTFLILPTVGIVVYFATEMNEGVAWSELISYALDSLMIAITLIVVAVPEGLPMAVTLSLAFSMKRLMKQNTLPRTMHSCETMGAVSVICSDKTGTLTQNRMSVASTLFPTLANQNLSDDRASDIIKECIATNTTANIDLSDPTKAKAVGNPTEGALLLWLHANGTNYNELRNVLPIVERLQFTTERKYMATVVNSVSMGRRMLYVKGAPDVLMKHCRLSESEKTTYSQTLSEYQSHAYRTLAFAYKELEESEVVFADGRLETQDLHMLGIVGIADPVRDDVPVAISECAKAGIEVKIVTGDAPGTAKEIGRRLGLWTETDTEENILLGTELAAMTDNELRERLSKVKIISRARPGDKERAVRTLKDLNYIVAVTGDGTNDAPALNAANVGLSMGDGTAVAKEASDMTILDNSFATIVSAVMWGRSLYKNIKRFILFQMTVNVVACLIVLIGAFVGTESPLTVTQMLWVNLIMDTFAALALASLPPSRLVMNERPRQIDEHILQGMQAPILIVGGLFTIVLLGIYAFFRYANIATLLDIFTGNIEWQSGELSAYELSLFFTTFVMLQFWNMFNAKVFMTSSSALSGISWRNTKWFILIAGIILVGQILMTETPGLQEMFNIAHGGISAVDWLIIILATSAVLWIGEAIRLIGRKKA